ncbi:hypothetical protein [uncultured Brevundimonas sp.]|uniref:hypothetical protein n=1 Tax=uncultured Brevundimonas sp. TaxID=213418 RepID=UPI0025E583FA|nr:hypothetical protein [uncultured Brevundimonas sp.]
MRRALVNGEFQAPLDARAKLWLEQAAETQSRISQRKVIWWMIIGVLATVSVGGAAAFATLAAN